MDALILSCGTGGGHNSAGKAVLEELERRGHHVTMLNPYTLKSEKLSSGIDQTYISTVQHAPDAFGAVYKIGDLYRRLPFRSPVYFVNHAMDSVMQEYFAEHHTDIVLMPHLFPAEIMTNMKLHGMQIPKTMFIATDYVCIPFTEETECDAYVIPAEDLKPKFVRKGIPEEKLYPFGIPTSAGFADEEPRALAKQRLGLDPDKNYILVAGGSMGGGKIEGRITALRDHFSRRKDTELIVICGSNRHFLYRQSSGRQRGAPPCGGTFDALYIGARRQKSGHCGPHRQHRTRRAPHCVRQILKLRTNLRRTGLYLLRCTRARCAGKSAHARNPPSIRRGCSVQSQIRKNHQSKAF